MYDFIFRTSDTSMTETFVDSSYIPPDEPGTEADPEVLATELPETESETETEIISADPVGRDIVPEASLGDVYIQLQVSNKLLGNLVTMQIFLLAFLFFWFFYKFIKNNITNHFM